MGAVYPVIWCPLDAATGKVVARPGHCRHVTPFDVSAEGVAAGTATPSGGPGRLWSVVPLSTIAGEWRETRDGWWVCLGDIQVPGQVARLRIMDGVVVRGSLGIPFMVPRLLRWQPEAGLVSALPSVWKDYEWVPIGELGPLIERLREAIGHAEIFVVVNDPEVMRLAIDIIALNYTGLSEHEFTFLQWFDTSLAKDVILAAAGWVDMEQRLAGVRAAGPAGTGHAG